MPRLPTRPPAPLPRALRPAALAALLPAAALAQGAPSLFIGEVSLKGASGADAYVQAVGLRTAVMAACFGSQAALDKGVRLEAYLDLDPKGGLRNLSLQSAGGERAEVDICLLEELNKVRFPAAEGPVELRIVLQYPDPAGEPEPEPDGKSAKGGKGAGKAP